MILTGVLKAFIFFGLCFVILGFAFLFEKALEWWEENDHKNKR